MAEHVSHRVPKPRISKRVREAVRYLVDEARSRAESAKLAGVTDDWFYRQLRRPEVRALKREREEVLRSGERARSFRRVADLADHAQSEHVKLGANELLLGIDGVSPVARSDIRVDHLVRHAPGLVIVRHNYAEAAARQAQLAANPQGMIDVTPSEPVTLIESEQDEETNIAILRDRSGAR